MSSPLEKAKLVAVDGGADIEFMFNPNELSFSRSVDIDQAAGARTESGENKTSFKHPNPYSLSIGNIILDTYEDGSSVLAPSANSPKPLNLPPLEMVRGSAPPSTYLPGVITNICAVLSKA
jgi:hypothetical protein